MESESPPLTVADLADGDWPSRIGALARLPTDGPIPVEFHSAVVGLLNAPESQQRETVVAVVARIGAPAVPLLMGVLADGPPEGDECRRAAVVALGRIGPAAKPAMALLRELTNDAWLGVCAHAALELIEPAPRPRWLHTLLAALLAVVLSVAVVARPPIDGGLLLAVVLVVVACLAVGVWWTRPGPVSWVMVFIVGVAVVIAWQTSHHEGGFGELANVLARP